ncbi:MAG: elongation factor Ts [Bacteroidetes bacterium]|nr:MAG: elongation factor Ts [Bacteroidota bacterium]
MQIKAADVAKLRKATGAGMMDCKKALQEAEGNFDKAVEIIREKGKAIANKRADREATEGTVLAKANGKNGVIIVLNCETDFVAKNENFVAFANSILDIALNEKPEDLNALKELKLDGKTIADAVVEQIGVIGEKLELSYYEKISAEYTVAYIHPGNRLATIVGFNQPDVDEQVAKDVAMQVAAMDPVAIDKDNVSQEVIDEEFKIAREKARLEGKPEEMLDKIATGRLGKFFKENTLLNQAFIKDGKKSVKQYLQENNKDLTVTVFKRFTLNV